MRSATDKSFVSKLQSSTGKHCKRFTIKGSSQAISKDDIAEYFLQFGDAKQFKVELKTNNKRHKGFGFITVYDKNFQDKMLTINQNFIHDCNVEIKLDLSTEEHLHNEKETGTQDWKFLLVESRKIWLRSN